MAELELGLPEEPSDLEAFEKELVELCLKHGFEIGGCGCCGSPWIVSPLGGEFFPVPSIPWPKEIVQEAKDIAFEHTFGKEFKF